MPEFDPPLRSLPQILHFDFISFLLFSKIISILSKKFHIFELKCLPQIEIISISILSNTKKMHMHYPY